MKQNKEFISQFEEMIQKEESVDIWKSPKEISGMTGFSETIVIEILKRDDDFLMNGNNEYTTKNFYIKFTPFYRGFMTS